MRKIQITKQFLIKEYIKNKKSTIKIAKTIPCSAITIGRYLKKYNVKTRTISEANKGHYPPNYIDGRYAKQYFCIDCNKEISTENGVNGRGRCHSCANKITSYIDGRTLKKYYCKDCDKEISPLTGFYGQGRCLSCAKIEKNNPNWQDGKSFELYPLGWTKTFKEQIRYRDGYKCQICGCPEIENNRKLAIHHIDYDKENIKPENLISLCNSCHGKTGHNKKYWITYFLNRVET